MARRAPCGGRALSALRVHSPPARTSGTLIRLSLLQSLKNPGRFIVYLFRLFPPSLGLGQLIPCLNVALPCCLSKPMSCLSDILRKAISRSVHHAQIILGLCVPLLRSFPIPFRIFLGVPGTPPCHSLTSCLIDVGQRGLLICGFGVWLHSCYVVLRKAPAIFIHDAKIGLSDWIAGIGRFYEPVRCNLVILCDVNSCYVERSQKILRCCQSFIG